MSIEGLRIGDYLVGRRLGIGGMAEVYVAERWAAGGFRRLVALKVLREHLRAQPAVVERFTREARLAAMLRHPNLVPVIDLGVQDGVVYLAMELVDGPDLRQAWRAGVDAGRPLPPALAVHVTIQVCRGLAHAHRQAGPDGRPLHLVHRDVSPQNILLSRAGEVRLTDFGIATAAWGAEESATATLRGKFAYLAPEQVEGRPADERADIFALGVVLWELLVGRRLFFARTEAETLARVRRCEVPLPPEPPPEGVPAALWSPLARALAPDPAARYDEAEAMAAALAAACPEADRGEASRRLAAWLATLPACEAGKGARATPLASGARPAPSGSWSPAGLTPTLVTSVGDRAVRTGPEGQPLSPGSSTMVAGRRATLAAGLVGVASLAAVGAIGWGLRSGGSEGATPPARVGVPRGGAPAMVAPLPAPTPPVPQGGTPGAAAGPSVAAVLVSPPAGVLATRASASPGARTSSADARSGQAAAARPPVPIWTTAAALILASDPAGAMVEVDGRPMGPTPRRVDALRPDEPILIRFRLDGYHIAERTVTPVAAAAVPVEVVLEPAFASLSLDTEPWAEVWMDGRRLGSTPMFQKRVRAGRHVVRLVHPPSGRATEIVVELAPEGELRRHVVLATPAEAGGARSRPGSSGRSAQLP